MKSPCLFTSYFSISSFIYSLIASNDMATGCEAQPSSSLSPSSLSACLSIISGMSGQARFYLILFYRRKTKTVQESISMEDRGRAKSTMENEIINTREYIFNRDMKSITAAAVHKVDTPALLHPLSLSTIWVSLQRWFIPNAARPPLYRFITPTPL